MLRNPIIAIHAGCDAPPKGGISVEQEEFCRNSLRDALLAGYSILKSGGKSVDAVVAAIKVCKSTLLTLIIVFLYINFVKKIVLLSFL